MSDFETKVIEPRNRKERRAVQSKNADGIYAVGEPSQGKVVLYFRVSTSKQGADGLSIDAQKAACLAHLNGGNWEIVGEFIEVASGAKNDRPQLQAALALCAKHGATLVVAKLDRLSRSALLISTLMESNIKFVCADQPHISDLTAHILAAAAQHDRQQISQRVKAAQAVMKAHIDDTGYHTTKSGKRLTKLGSDTFESVQLAGREKRMAAADLYASRVYPVIEQCRKLGMNTMREIAKELTDRNIQTPARQASIDKGKSVFGQAGYGEGEWHWHPQQVKLLIDRVEKNG